MKNMKKDWEIYRDTGILGAYYSGMSILRKAESGEVDTIFRDSACWNTDEGFIRETAPIVKHIFSLCVENTHEPLISKEQWDIVQDVRRHKKRTRKQMDEPSLFSGIAYCADCGKPMFLHRASCMEKQKYNLKCSTYGKRGKEECSSHHIREIILIQIVLDDLRRVTHFARMKERQFAEYINQKNSVELRREINTLQKELDAMRKRNNELSIKHLHNREK